MRLIVISLLIGLSLWGKMINAVAVIVDGEPITTYEILNLSQKLGITKKDAIDLLVRQKLEQKQIKKFGIKVSDREVQEAILNIARSKGMTLAQLQAALASQGVSWQNYTESIKKQLLRKKLYRAIMQITARNISEQDLRNYYNTHPHEFTLARSVVVTKYISPSQELLEEIARGGNVPKENTILLTIDTEKVDLDRVNPQFAALLSRTPEGSYTPILPLGDKFLLLYIQKKEGTQNIPFEEARSYIINKLAKQKNSNKIQEYFDKLKAAADIKIIRLP